MEKSVAPLCCKNILKKLKKNFQKPIDKRENVVYNKCTNKGGDKMKVKFTPKPKAEAEKEIFYLYRNFFIKKMKEWRII